MSPERFQEAPNGRPLAQPFGVATENQGEVLLIRLHGDWRARPGLPFSVGDSLGPCTGVSTLRFSTRGLDAWDSGLIVYLRALAEFAGSRGITLDPEGLPEGARGLLHLATAVPERVGAARDQKRTPFLATVGTAVRGAADNARDMLAFLGEATRAFGRLLHGRARFRRSDFWLVVESAGPAALPIVTLISFLVGLILAFVGAVQLQQFGAQIFVANLVGLAMAREMGAIMTGIIMAGRTGAAFAAQLGSMRVNQEIDALTTLGFSPMEFLVLPRMLALMLMMPLLTLYSDFVGILGGMVVATGMLDIGVTEYYQQTIHAVTARDFFVGLIKSAVFGVLVALSGCLCGIRTGGSSTAVGDAATDAVVMGIVFIIVTDALFTILFNILGV